MTEDKKTWTFKQEDIFEEIPDDPNNINMKIPEEIAERIGLKPGDKMKILWGDKGTIVIQKLTEEEENEQG